ncbi:MAG: SLC13 family permease [Planctomycetaceae bacterium]|nr:SLC13 family permease [Planctomycetaceae bacterium]
MTWEAWLSVAAVVVMLVGLARNWGPPDLLVLSVLLCLLVVREVSGSERLPSAGESLAGLANPAVVTVGALFVVVAGLVRTGAMTRFARPMMGRTETSIPAAQARLIFPIAGFSAFLNNTPVVAMFLPIVSDLCRRTGISPSKLYMPLTVAATLGGLCTLIGTSTNLVVSGLIAKQTDLGSLTLFEPAWVGIPCCLAGLIYILVAQKWLLPDRQPGINRADDPREYSVEMLVPQQSPMVGQSIEQAGLRHLPGLFLIEIDRHGEVLAAVSPQERLRSGDRLIFVGSVESTVELQRLRGLAPAVDPSFQLSSGQRERSLIEVVVSDRCPLVGSSIRDGHFRTVYDAAVVAVARSGRRISGRIGDIVLQAGDTLLLEARPSFVKELQDSPDFYLISGVENSTSVRHNRANVAIAILACLVIVASMEWLEMVTASLLAAALMIVTGCCSVSEAHKSIDWSVLLVIGGSLGVGLTLDRSGAALAIANAMIGWAGGEPYLVLGAVYLTTMLFTELITNNAAAVLVFPIGIASAASLGLSPMPFAMAVMMAASAGFATPIGYQTNLMVYGPGGYRFSDYLRFGIPLDLLIMTICLILIPLIWPFAPVR